MRRVDKERPRLWFRVFDVGQGDSLLLKWFSGDRFRYGIVDCCMRSTDEEPPVLKYLKREEVEELEFICLTHPDLDHFYGLPSVLSFFQQNELKIKAFWQFGALTISEIWFSFLKRHREIEDAVSAGLQEEEAITLHRRAHSSCRADEYSQILQWLDQELRDGQEFWYKKLVGVSQITSYDEVQIHCVAPTSRSVKKFQEHISALLKDPAVSRAASGESPNLVSTILLIMFGAGSLLLGGDAGHREWVESLNEAEKQAGIGPDQLRANLLKASHHGSRHSISGSIVNRILSSDATVVISADYRGNTYGHPHIETIKLLCQAGISQIFCTNRPQWHCDDSTTLSELDPDIEHGFKIGLAEESSDMDEETLSLHCLGEMEFAIDQDGKVELTYPTKE